MPNDEIVTKIEELKKICDPNDTEATLVHELKQINEKIVSIQNELSELNNIPEVIYYDDIQESRDSTRKAELNRQIIELEKKVSVLDIELKELKAKESTLNKMLRELQQDRNRNVDTASAIRTYEASLISSESKDNMNSILAEVERKVNEDTKFFQILETQYKELQEAIEKKASLINSIKENIKNYQKQLEQISTDLLNREKYINQEKKNNDLAKIAELEKELKSLTEQQAKIVENPIMLISLANKAALEGDLVAILNKIKSVKELLLQKPFMDIPESSIQEQTAKAIEERNTFYNQINGKDYTAKGLPAADDRIDEMNAYIAKWIEEVNTLKSRKEEIDNGTKYGSARKIREISETIIKLDEEVTSYETKEYLTADEEVALDKRKKEIEALKIVLNSYFADQNANIGEAECIEENIKILEARTVAAKAEIKDLRKMSKSLAGVDIMSKKRDSDKLQEYVNIVMDLKKLPEYRRILVVVDEILDALGKDIVVPTIEEVKEEILVTGESEVQQTELSKEESVPEIHPIEEVKVDEINIQPPQTFVDEQNVTPTSTEEIKHESTLENHESASSVVFEPVFKEEIVNANMSTLVNGNLKTEANNSINKNANRVVATEKIKSQPKQEVVNPFANISDLKTVDSEHQKEGSISEPTPASPTVSTLKVENQERTVVEQPIKESIKQVSMDAPIKEDIMTSSIKPQKVEEVIEPVTSSIDDFFAQQWGEVSTDNVQTLGKVA